MAEVIRVGAALIDGVVGIHAQGALHGDLFRENVMITTVGVKIIDCKPGESLRRLSSMPRSLRVRGDIDDVVDLCEELLRAAGASEDCLAAFDGAVGGRRRTLEDVRAAFETATGTRGSPAQTPAR